MILEVECRAHTDEIQSIHSSIGEVSSELKTVKAFTSETAQAERKAELDTLRDAVGR